MKLYKHFNQIWGIIIGTILPLSRQQKIIENISASKIQELSQENSYPPFHNCLSCLNYRDKIVRESLWSFKFKNNSSLAKIFAEILYDNLLEELSELKLYHNFEKPLLIPIPITKKKKVARGYNQTELIAQELKKLDTQNIFDYRKNTLKKIKDTLPQSRTKNKKERENNLKSCFKVVMPKLIRDRNIILLDDIITTGSTLQEASREIEKYNPRNIIWLTVAH